MTRLCECGCGEATKLAKHTDHRKGIVKGEPLRFLRNHQVRMKARELARGYKSHWLRTERVPYGYCLCGCGERTEIAKQSDPRFGHVWGEPKRYLLGHNKRTYTVPYIEEDRGHDSRCWIWQGAKGALGYGHIWRDGGSRPAHRVFYEDRRGPIPGGLPLDHLCRVPSCVNPNHLEPVTAGENNRRGAATRLTVKDADCIRRLYATGEYTYPRLGAMYGVDRSHIGRIVRKESWADERCELRDELLRLQRRASMRGAK